MGKLFCLSFFSKKSKVAKAMHCAEMTQNPQLFSGKNAMDLPDVFTDAKLSVGRFINDPLSDQSPHSVDSEQISSHANGFLSNGNTHINVSSLTEECNLESSQSRKNDDYAVKSAYFASPPKVSAGKEFPGGIDTEIDGTLEKLSIVIDKALDNGNAQIAKNAKEAIAEGNILDGKTVGSSESFLLVEEYTGNGSMRCLRSLHDGEKLGSDSFDNYSGESDSESLGGDSTRQESQISPRPVRIEVMSPTMDFYNDGKQREFVEHYVEGLFINEVSPDKAPPSQCDRTECDDDLEAGHLSDPGVYQREEMRSLNGSPVLHRNGSVVEGSVSSQNHESHSFVSKSVTSVDMMDNLSVRTNEHYTEIRNDRLDVYDMPTEYHGKLIQEEQTSEGKDPDWWVLASKNLGPVVDKGLSISDIQAKPASSNLSCNKNLSRVEEWINNIEEPEYEEMVIATEEVGESSNSQQPISVAASCEVANAIPRTLHAFSTVAHLNGINLRDVPQIGHFNCLKTLYLSGNSITRVPAGCLPQSLHVLDLSNNKIPQIEGLRELTRLRILNLSHNRISKIGHGLANCTLIKQLYLAGNKIAEVEGLHRLLKLSVLDLSHNKIATSKGLGQLAANYSSLLALNLVGNPILANIGDEQVRKLVTSLAPHVTYLNKHAIKAVSVREAVIDSVARAALGTHRSKSSHKGGSIRSLRASSQQRSQKKPVSNRTNKDSEKKTKSKHHHHHQHNDNTGTSGRHHGERNHGREPVITYSSFAFDTGLVSMHRSRSEPVFQEE